MRRTLTGHRTILSIVAILAVIVSLLPGASPANADSAPRPPETVRTVTSDSLPTVQVDGIVWDQLIVGNTVYVTGSFTYARPAGAGSRTGRVVRNGALAYDIRTGRLIGRWRPKLNGPGRSLAVSSDHSMIYIGGDFTQVDRINRKGIVAVHPVTGSVIRGFRADSNGRVASMAVSGRTLYFGGNFTTVSGRARQRLAAVRSASGTLLAWAPRADRLVNAVVVPRGVGNVVVGGRFDHLNGVNAPGMGALNAATGQTRRWLANQLIMNHGEESAITSLSTDQSGSAARVFGTAYNYNGPSHFEGTFRASGVDGRISWLNACKGDTYDAVPVGQVVYSVGHSHYCSMIGGQPEAAKGHERYQRALATTTNREGTNTEDFYRGRPAPRLLHWLPTINTGTVTGQAQGAWTITANSDYVVLGGEFTQVNRRGQQGLARFSVSGKAPNREGPQGFDQLKPAIAGASGGAAVLRWTSAWDRDNRTLDYEVLRGSTAASSVVVGKRTSDSSWWNQPRLGLTDIGVAPGSRQTYRIRATDPFGNRLTSNPVTIRVPNAPAASTAYREAVLADGPSTYWRLGETTGHRAYDWQGSNDLGLSRAVGRNQTGAVRLDSDRASSFPGTPGVHAASQVREAAPQTFSLEAWVRTTSKRGGKIVGFGASRTRASTAFDRHIYMDNQGRISFGVYRSGMRRITSAAGFNNGAWHHIVGTLGRNGMTLHVDGKQVGRDASTTSASRYSGYWRVGGDTMGRWPAAGSSAYLQGSIDEVAVYRRQLTSAQIVNHAARGANHLPVAAFDTTLTGLTVGLDATRSSDADGGALTYEWAFGDGVKGTGQTASHAYAKPGTYTIALTVTDVSGGVARTTRVITVAEPPNEPPVPSFTVTPTDLAVALDASASSDPEGTALTLAWDFGDGTTGDGVTTTHTYTLPGAYIVALTATDAKGLSATASHPVTVDAPVEPPPVEPPPVEEPPVESPPVEPSPPASP